MTPAEDDFEKLKNALAAAVGKGIVDDAIEGDDIGLYDSATGDDLKIEKRVVLSGARGMVSLCYTTAKRGRICQLRQRNMHVHYFIDEPSGQNMIREDEDRNGVELAEILKHAPGGEQ